MNTDGVRHGGATRTAGMAGLLRVGGQVPVAGLGAATGDRGLSQISAALDALAGVQESDLDERVEIEVRQARRALLCAHKAWADAEGVPLERLLEPRS